MWRSKHLPPCAEKEPMQGVRKGEHLPAQSAKESVQGVRRGKHLPARAEKEPMQECGGAICKTCKADKNESMPPDLEEL